MEIVTPDVATRFWSKVEIAQGCWLWKGSRGRRGYGTFTINRKPLRAHRLSWEIANGQAIPDGLLVCHRCDNPPCVNPAHLFVGTQSDNIKDAYQKGRIEPHPPEAGHGWQRRLTHCSKGHLLAGDNLHVRPQGWRMCRTCYRLRKKVFRQRHRAAVEACRAEESR